MDKLVRKSIRNGVIAFFVIGLFSFIYGGIYTEMIKEGIGFSFYNLFFAFIGAFAISGVISFIIVFVISIVIYYLKDKK